MYIEIFFFFIGLFIMLLFSFHILRNKLRHTEYINISLVIWPNKILTDKFDSSL